MGLVSLYTLFRILPRKQRFYIDFHMKEFIKNTVLSAAQNSNNNVGQMNGVPNTCQAIVELVNFRNVLQKTFKTNCTNEVIRSKIKGSKGYYSILLL